MGNPALDILISVVVTSAIQSVFGVGVLLFGTPLLLLLGHGFVRTLTVLLPISISINLIQIALHGRHVDFSLYRRILVYTIPFVVLCLVWVTEVELNIGFVVGPFLVFVACKDFSRRVGAMVTSLMRFERTYLVVMGVVHGLTNLGGSLLTALVHGRGYDKDTTRVTTAIAYCTFAVFQLATLIVTRKLAHVDGLQEVAYVGAGIMVFGIVDQLVYVNIDNRKYKSLFAAFLFASGCLLLYKAIHQAIG
jgi:uncharacterized membrane protein YfcA